MVKPRALVLYEKAQPGIRLADELEQLGYDVSALHEADSLVAQAQQKTPLVILIDLESAKGGICEAIGELKKHSATEHIPVLAFGNAEETEWEQQAREAGADLVATDSTILTYLSQFLDQALEVT